MADWAERFQEGRVFLAGDAAHVMPPTGGFGGNAGVHDADNLAWKLAAVLRGEAGPGLLATYDAERRPVAEFTVEQAYTRYVLRLDPGARQGEPDADRRRGDGRARLSLPLGRRGARARRGRLAVGEPARADGAAGLARAASRARTRGRRGSSTLDLVRRGFVLLAGPAGEAWCRAAGAASAELGVPIESRAIDRHARLRASSTARGPRAPSCCARMASWPGGPARRASEEKRPCAGAGTGPRRRPSGAGGSCRGRLMPGPTPRSGTTSTASTRRCSRPARARRSSFFHGAGTATGFDELLPLARRRAADPAEPPGIRRVRRRPQHRRVQDYVMHYLDLFDRLGLDEISLVGHSLGGVHRCDVRAPAARRA